MANRLVLEGIEGNAEEGFGVAAGVFIVVDDDAEGAGTVLRFFPKYGRSCLPNRLLE